jgi:hypothetical protein
MNLFLWLICQFCFVSEFRDMRNGQQHNMTCDIDLSNNCLKASGLLST